MRGLDVVPVGLVLALAGTVGVMAVDLSVQLEHLAYKVQNARGGISHAG